MEQASTHLRTRILLASLVSLFLVSYVDYITGYELLFFVFYFVPIVLCGWFLGLGSTLGMAAVSGASWFVVDWLSGHRYPHEAFRYWNSFICFVAFAAIGLVLHRLRQIMAEQQRVQLELLKALDDLNRSTAEIRKLQSDLQVVCAWTKQIRINGQWISFDKFLADNLHVRISHGISPEALEEVRKSLDHPGDG